MPIWEGVDNECYAGILMAQVLRMPRRRLTQEELEVLGSEAIRQYKRFDSEDTFWYTVAWPD